MRSGTRSVPGLGRDLSVGVKMEGQSRTDRGTYTPTHGVYQATRILNELGIGALDGRTRIAREVAEWRDALVADLGGEQAVSTQQLGVVEQACRIRVIIDVMDSWLFGGDGRILNEKGRPHDLLATRRRYASVLLDILRALGLERRRPLPEDLTAYVEREYGNGDER